MMLEATLFRRGRVSKRLCHAACSDPVALTQVLHKYNTVHTYIPTHRLPSTGVPTYIPNALYGRYLPNVPR